MADASGAMVAAEESGPNEPSTAPNSGLENQFMCDPSSGDSITIQLTETEVDQEATAAAETAKPQIDDANITDAVPSVKLPAETPEDVKQDYTDMEKLEDTTELPATEAAYMDKAEDTTVLRATAVMDTDKTEDTTVLPTADDTDMDKADDTTEWPATEVTNIDKAEGTTESPATDVTDMDKLEDISELHATKATDIVEDTHDDIMTDTIAEPSSAETNESSNNQEAVADSAEILESSSEHVAESEASSGKPQLPTESSEQILQTIGQESMSVDPAPVLDATDNLKIKQEAIESTCNENMNDSESISDNFDKDVEQLVDSTTPIIKSELPEDIEMSEPQTENTDMEKRADETAEKEMESTPAEPEKQLNGTEEAESERLDLGTCESEVDGERTVTMLDVLQEQEELEDNADAVLGASDDNNCTYNEGYIKRQALYACLTCCSEAKVDPTKRAGVCLACSLACHDKHDLIELYTKRNFRCDCGNPKFNSHPCTFIKEKSELNVENKYNQNFSGLYCICHRPYPDPESTDDEEMIQCIVCEDWLHSSHLGATLPDNDQYVEMICKACMDKNDFLHDYGGYAVNIEDMEIRVVNGDDKINGDQEVTENTTEKTQSDTDLKEVADIDNIRTEQAEVAIQESSVEKTALQVADIVDNNEISKNGTPTKESPDTVSNVNGNQTYMEAINDDKSIAEPIEVGTSVNTEISSESTSSETVTEGAVQVEHTKPEQIGTDSENTSKNEQQDPVIESQEENKDIDTEVPNLSKTQLTDDLQEPVVKQEDMAATGDTISATNDESKLCEETTCSKVDIQARTVETANNANEIASTDEIKTADSEMIQVESQNLGSEAVKEMPVTEAETQVEADRVDTDIEMKDQQDAEPAVTTLIETNKETFTPVENVNEQELQTKECESPVEAEKVDTDIEMKDQQDGEASITTSVETNKETATSFEKSANQIEQELQSKESESLVEAVNVDTDMEMKDQQKTDTATSVEAHAENITHVENSPNEDQVETSVKESECIVEADKVATDVEMKDQQETELSTLTCVENDKETVHPVENNDVTIDTNDLNKTIDASEVSSNGSTNKRKLSTDVIEQDDNAYVKKTKLDNCTSDEPKPTQILESDETVSFKKAELNNGINGETLPIDVIEHDKTEPVNRLDNHINNEHNCKRPKATGKRFKGATFWPCSWRQKLCSCSNCVSMYRDLSVLFLLDLEDTVTAYEDLGKAKTDGKSSQYEKGLKALSSLDRIQQINALTEYNKMKDELLNFLVSFKDRQEVVKVEDIEKFFSDIKPKKKSDGVYFCR